MSSWFDIAQRHQIESMAMPKNIPENMSENISEGSLDATITDDLMSQSTESVNNAWSVYDTIDSDDESVNTLSTVYTISTNSVGNCKHDFFNDEGNNVCLLCGIIISSGCSSNSIEYNSFQREVGDTSNGTYGNTINTDMYKNNSTYCSGPIQMRTIHMRYNNNSKNRILCAARKDILKYCGEIFPEKIINEAALMYDTVAQTKRKRGLNRRGLLAACIDAVYENIENKKEIFTKEYIANLFGVSGNKMKHFTNGCRALGVARAHKYNESLSVSRDTMDTKTKLSNDRLLKKSVNLAGNNPNKFLVKYCKKLQLPLIVPRILLRCLKRIHRKDIKIAHEPTSINAALIWFIIDEYNLEISKQTLAILTGRTYLTIRNTHNDVMKYKHAIIQDKEIDEMREYFEINKYVVPYEFKKRRKRKTNNSQNNTTNNSLVNSSELIPDDVSECSSNMTTESHIDIFTKHESIQILNDRIRNKFKKKRKIKEPEDIKEYEEQMKAKEEKRLQRIKEEKKKKKRDRKNRSSKESTETGYSIGSTESQKSRIKKRSKK